MAVLHVHWPFQYAESAAAETEKAWGWFGLPAAGEGSEFSAPAAAWTSVYWSPGSVLFDAAGGGGDVEVAITGQAVTASAGIFAPQAQVPVIGSAVTASAGTFAPQSSTGITGIAITASAGTLTAAVSAALSGSEVVSATGTLTYSADEPIVEVALTGQAVTVSDGSFTEVSISTAPLTGLALTVSAGTLTASEQAPADAEIPRDHDGWVDRGHRRTYRRSFGKDRSIRRALERLLEEEILEVLVEEQNAADVANPVSKDALRVVAKALVRRLPELPPFTVAEDDGRSVEELAREILNRRDNGELRAAARAIVQRGDHTELFAAARALALRGDYEQVEAAAKEFIDEHDRETKEAAAVLVERVDYLDIQIQARELLDKLH